MFKRKESEGAYNGKFNKSYASRMQLVTKKSYASNLYNTRKCYFLHLQNLILYVEREDSSSSRLTSPQADSKKILTSSSVACKSLKQVILKTENKYTKCKNRKQVFTFLSTLVQ